MKNLITSVVCLFVGVIAGWYLVHRHAEAQLQANMLHVVIGYPEGTYSETGLLAIAERYLSDHHVAPPRNGIGLFVHVKPMDVDSHPVMATVVFFDGDLGSHAVDIGTDGAAVRDYAIKAAGAL